MPASARATLRKLLSARLNFTELKSIVFDLHISDTAGLTETRLAEHIIEYLEKRDRLNDLIDWLKENRPDIDISINTSIDSGPPSNAPIPTDKRPKWHQAIIVIGVVLILALAITLIPSLMARLPLAAPVPTRTNTPAPPTRTPFVTLTPIGSSIPTRTPIR